MQQILQAVNTIHEDRIVHSDLKPANFLLVKGSLKLIDFGIAKAIMSDTTNIQRDAQVFITHCSLQLLIQSTIPFYQSKFYFYIRYTNLLFLSVRTLICKMMVTALLITFCSHRYCYLYMLHSNMYHISIYQKWLITRSTKVGSVMLCFISTSLVPNMVYSY